MKGLHCPKKNSRSELFKIIGTIALTLKQNCAKWHKNCALEGTSSRLKGALSNVSKNETEICIICNVSFVIRQVCFQNSTFLGHQNI